MARTKRNAKRNTKSQKRRETVLSLNQGQFGRHEKNLRHPRKAYFGLLKAYLTQRRWNKKKEETLISFYESQIHRLKQELDYQKQNEVAWYRYSSEVEDRAKSWMDYAESLEKDLRMAEKEKEKS